MGAADEGVLSAIGVDVFADWVEFADEVEFENDVELGEAELDESELRAVEAAVAVELLFEDTVAVEGQQWKQSTNILKLSGLGGPFSL